MKSSGFPPSSTAAPWPHAEASSTGVPSLQVLIVDDDPGICQLVTVWLERLGHQVACAAGGVQAEKLLAVRRFDVVVTDIVMPDGDGFELMSAVRRQQPSARILAISGGGKYLRQPECLKIAKGLGASLVIEKPFTREQFLNCFTAVTSAPNEP